MEQNKDVNELNSFIEQFNVQYPITNSNQNYDLAKVLGGVRSIPTMFMYSKSGKLIQKYVGIVPEEMLETDIKKAIKVSGAYHVLGNLICQMNVQQDGLV